MTDDYSDVQYEDDPGDEYMDQLIRQDETDIEIPEERGITIYKYQVEADVPVAQRPNLDPYRPFYGRHVPLGNTKRMDNLRMLDAYDVATMLEMCPTLRDRATELKGRVLTELQLFRSNEGFERRMEATTIKQQAVELSDKRYEQIMKSEGNKTKRFKLFRRKKGE